MMKTLACLCLVALGIVPQLTHAAEWKMDAASSRLDFAASFEKAPAPGVFKEFDVRMVFDPKQSTGSHLDVSIRVASADMASADINKAIAGPEWFDFAKYPQAEFHSTDIQAAASGYVARGTLTLKGVKQPVEVPFTWSATGDGATMEGQFVAKRASFGIGTGEWLANDVIGPDVTVKFRVRMK